MSNPLFAISLMLLAGQVLAQADPAERGYRIEVEVEGFEEKEAYLANYFMDKQYIVDTSTADGEKIVFEGDEALKPGTYLLVLPPNNDYAQVQIGEDQRFKLKTKVDELTANMRVKGSAENELFFDYLQFLAKMRPAADSLRLIAADSTLPQPTRDAAQAEVDAIDTRVKDLQASIKRDHPETMTAVILRGLDEPVMPDFEGTEAEVQEKRYRYYKAHYFDNIDLGDPRMLRSSFMDQRVSYYLDKLVIPHPDSIALELDYILAEMRPAPETFRFYTSKFLNDYAASKLVGMDAVYVHLAEKYYMSGIADWADSTTVAKITDNVVRTKPLLLGKPAPEITVITRDNEKVALSEVDAEFTVLFFFDPECGHCKKQTPHVIDFAKKYADKGVKVISVCTKFAPDQDSCWSYVDDKEGMAENMLNAVDPYHRSKFKIKYDISSTPQVYVLDREKTIVSKKISGEQLDDVVGRMIAIKEEQEVKKAAEGR